MLLLWVRMLVKLKKDLSQEYNGCCNVKHWGKDEAILDSCWQPNIVTRPPWFTKQQEKKRRVDQSRVSEAEWVWGIKDKDRLKSVGKHHGERQGNELVLCYLLGQLYYRRVYFWV